MKKRNILRKAGAVFLSLALAVGLVPGMEARKVLAAEELSQNSQEAEEGSVSFEALEGTKGASDSEGIGSLVDGKYENGNFSKWCVTGFKGAYVIIKASEPVLVKGYSLVTGDDNSSNSGRNPKSWKLYACNGESAPEKGAESWTEIASVENGGMEDVNYQKYDFDLSVQPKEVYQYFKLEISEIGSDSTVMQLGELILEYSVCKHNWADTGNTLPARCTEGGKIEQKCSKCEAIRYVSDGTVAKGHAWADTGETASASCIESAQKKQKCSACGQERWVSDGPEPKGHQWKDGVCTVCGKEEKAVSEPSKDKNGTYQISTSGELYWFAGLVNRTIEEVEADCSANAVLMNDITLNQDLLKSLEYDKDGKVTNADKFKSWTPIKGDINGYSGNFDGKNHAIRGVFSYDEKGYDVGLFGVVSAGKISNVRVEDSYFYGYDNVGGICGTNKSSSTSDADIKNCSVDGMVKGFEDVGGICGFNEKGTIENCSKEGTVIGSGNIGGICGNSSGKVVTCQNMGAVEGTGDYVKDVGGVCGYNEGEITTSQNKGTVKEQGQEFGQCAGGVSGYNCGKIIASQNMGAVEGTGDYVKDVGGVCGYNNGEITTSQNMGAVEGNYSVGGVCGNMAEQVADCQNTGDVKGNNVVGGICGFNSYSEIVNCCSTGKVIKKEDAEGDPVSEDQDKIGAVVGEVYSGSEKNCYFNSDVCSQPAIGRISEASTVESVCSKSALAFESGEVCYLLNNKRTKGTDKEPLNWYQNLDIPGEAQDPLPVLDRTHGRVYYVEAECFKGYSNDPDKKHRLEYAADDEADRITVSCRDCKVTFGALWLKAPEGPLWYDGKAKEASVENTVSGAAVSTPAITYRTKDGSVLEAAPVEAGTYTAGISLMDAKGAEYSVSVEYTIRKKESTGPDSGGTGSGSSGSSGGGSGSSDSAGQPGTGTAQAGSKNETTITTNPDGSRTETTITANPDGSRTETAVTTRPDGSRTESTVITGADGSRTESTVTTGVDGSRTESTVTTGADGSRTESTVTTGADGSRTESTKTEDKAAGTTVVEEKTKAADGTTSEKKTETRKDGSVTETFTETKPDGTSTEISRETKKNGAGTEISKETRPDGSTTETTTKTDAKGVEKSTAVAKDASTGNVLTVTKTVESSGSVKKASAVLVTKEKTITKSDADEAEALAGKTNVSMTVKIKDKKGNLLYKVKVNTKDIKADSALFVYRYDEKTKTYHLVKKNSQKAKADEEGNIRLDLEKGKSSQRYELAGKKQAAAIEKKILAGIKPKNSSRKVSAGQAAAFKMAKGFDMEDVKTIRYASKDSSVAVIDKNGKITAKKPGKTVVTAEVTLKNGKTKTVKMKVEVTE